MFEELSKMDSHLLLSLINTKLRDYHPSLDDLCRYYDISPQRLQEKLAGIAYYYHPTTNQFQYSVISSTIT